MTDYFEHIEDYMSDRLSAEQKAAFELAMESDSVLRQAVADWPTAAKLSEGLLELDVLATIQGLEAAENLDEGMPRDHTKVIQIDPSSKGLATDQSYDVSRKPWLWAVLLLAVGGLAVWLYNSVTVEQQHEQWYAEVYQRPVDPDATKSIDTVGMDMLQKGKYFFALNDYEQSEAILRDLLQQTNDADTTRLTTYWLGHALVGQGKWEGREMLGE